MSAEPLCHAIHPDRHDAVGAARTTPHVSGGHRWKVLFTGVAANACFSAIFSGVPTTAVVMRFDYSLSNAQLGFVLGFLGLGVAVSEMPWGLLTDRWGDRRVLLAGLGSLAAWLALMAFTLAPSAVSVPDDLALAFSLLAVGLLGGSVNGASGRAIMAWFGEGERGFAMSVRQTAVPLGGGLGALCLPALALHAGFATVYAVLAGLAVICTFLTWLWLHEPPAKPGHSGQDTQAVAVLPNPLRSGEVWRLAIAIGLLCLPQVAVLTFATVFLHDFAGAGTLLTSTALAVVQVGAMVMRVWSGRWTDRHRNRPAYLRACALLGIAGFAAVALLVALVGPNPALPALAMLTAMLVFAGVCISAWHGVAYTEIATLAGASRVGSVLGLANTIVFVAFFVVPLSIPHLLTAISWSGIWLAGALCALAALPLLPRAHRDP